VALKITYEATSDQACVVNVLGEFKPGETKIVSDADVDLFEKFFGYRLAESHFAPWFHLSVVMTEEA
jgi:hypothetical protein